MKILTLNTWGGRAGKEKLLSFFDKNKDIDVFCLQEIWSAPYENYDGHLAGGMQINHDNILTNGLAEITKILSNHNYYFRPHFLDNYGLLMLVRKDYKVVAEGEVFVYREKGHIPNGDIGNHARNLQYVTIASNDQVLTILNFHGLWNGKGKTDSEDRILQSKNIIKFLASLSGEFVLCGDFNLLPDTESIKILEDFGLTNLIKKYNIKSTRTSFYNKLEKFADYVFLSKNLKEKSFEISPDEVSDHAPIVVEI